MRRFPLASLMALVATTSVLPRMAAEIPANPPGDSPVTAPEGTEVTAPAKAKRPFSADTAAKLTAAVPKFEAPAAAATPGGPGVAESPLAHELDKPRNQIIRLPQYVVGEPKVHLPSREMEVLTPKGRVEYALDRRPGLRFGPLAWLNGPIALAMLDDDLAAERRHQEAELWSLYRIHDAVATDASHPVRPKEP